MKINEENKNKFLIKNDNIKKKFIINIKDINNYTSKKFKNLKIIPNLIKISKNNTLNNKNKFNEFNLEQLKNINDNKKFNFLEIKKYVTKQIIENHKKFINQKKNKKIYYFHNKTNYSNMNNNTFSNFNTKNKNNLTNFYTNKNNKNYLSNKNIKDIEIFDDSFKDDIYNILYNFDKNKIIDYCSTKENEENFNDLIIYNKLNNAFDMSEKKTIKEKLKSKYFLIFKSKK